MNLKLISCSFLPFGCYTFMLIICTFTSTYFINWEYAMWYMLLLFFAGLLASLRDRYGQLLLYLVGLTVLIIGVNYGEAGLFEMIAGSCLMGYSLWLYKLG